MDRHLKGPWTLIDKTVLLFSIMVPGPGDMDASEFKGKWEACGNLKVKGEKQI